MGDEKFQKAVLARFDAIDARFDRVDARMDSLHAHLDDQEAAIDDLARKTDTIQVSLHRLVEATEHALDRQREHGRRMTGLEGPGGSKA
jgi:peptidoglycan hydrolase CwlO-like protein